MTETDVEQKQVLQKIPLYPCYSRQGARHEQREGDTGQTAGIGLKGGALAKCRKPSIMQTIGVLGREREGGTYRL